LIAVLGRKMSDPPSRSLKHILNYTFAVCPNSAANPEFSLPLRRSLI